MPFNSGWVNESPWFIARFGRILFVTTIGCRSTALMKRERKKSAVKKRKKEVLFFHSFQLSPSFQSAFISSKRVKSTLPPASFSPHSQSLVRNQTCGRTPKKTAIYLHFVRYYSRLPLNKADRLIETLWSDGPVDLLRSFEPISCLVPGSIKRSLLYWENRLLHQATTLNLHCSFTQFVYILIHCSQWRWQKGLLLALALLYIFIACFDLSFLCCVLGALHSISIESFS